MMTKTASSWVESTESSPQVITYAYDPLGRRIEKNVNGTITRYLYDQEDILLEYDQAGTVIARYVHGPGIDEPLAMEKTGQMYYYHADGLGSIIALTDSAGAVVQSYQYYAFGNIMSSSPAIVQPYTYTAREYDPETGLYFYRARYYDSKAGRFLQRDPIGFASGDVNLYAYVKDNPTKYSDPHGLYPGCCGNENYTWVPDRAREFDFNEPCKVHDMCYGCQGKDVGKSKIQCDTESWSGKTGQ